MALTEFQRSVCRVIAANRVRGGESYVAGGAALAEITASPRISRDIDLFHDSSEARDMVDALPPEYAGQCVLARSGALFAGGASDLRRALAQGELRFHEGSIRGAFPQIAS